MNRDSRDPVQQSPLSQHQPTEADISLGSHTPGVAAQNLNARQFGRGTTPRPGSVMPHFSDGPHHQGVNPFPCLASNGSDNGLTPGSNPLLAPGTPGTGPTQPGQVVGHGRNRAYIPTETQGTRGTFEDEVWRASPGQRQ
ncbi:hypothetical protein P3T36_004860 [Kitasatospora sp. MAP12-15]|nr:hypothetical protein [Kitasatospora sp. MAP12-44]